VFVETTRARVCAPLLVACLRAPRPARKPRHHDAAAGDLPSSAEAKRAACEEPQAAQDHARCGAARRRRADRRTRSGTAGGPGSAPPGGLLRVQDPVEQPIYNKGHMVRIRRPAATHINTSLAPPRNSPTVNTTHFWHPIYAQWLTRSTCRRSVAGNLVCTEHSTRHSSMRLRPRAATAPRTRSRRPVNAARTQREAKAPTTGRRARVEPHPQRLSRRRRSTRAPTRATVPLRRARHLTRSWSKTGRGHTGATMDETRRP
jgi:hypothetical protein